MENTDEVSTSKPRLMDLRDREPMHETNVKIPVKEAIWIKQNGMTYAGAFRRGLDALRQVIVLQQENRDLVKNMGIAQRKLSHAYEQLEALGKKVE